MPDVPSLVVNGLRYSGWKSIRITLSIESIAGSFSVDVSDRWDGEHAPWPIAEGDACRVDIDDETVIDGWIDKRRVSCDATSRSLGYEGRDRASDLVDCSAIVDAGDVTKGKWTFTNMDVVGITTAIAKPFGIPVSVQAGLGSLLAKNKKIVVHPGDTCFEVISRIAAAAGVLVVSDGSGGIVITRTGTERASPLIEGENIKTASVEYDTAGRFNRILLSSQVPGTDEASGDATRIQAEAIDLGVRIGRVLLIRPDKGYSTADAKRRADWEARIRAAKAEHVTIGVVGWRQASGKLWKPNTVSYVKAPRSIGVEGDLLISQVEFSVDDTGGRITQLSLVRPDAFTPEPTATVESSSDGAGAWKELAKGAL